MDDTEQVARDVITREFQRPLAQVDIELMAEHFPGYPYHRKPSDYRIVKKVIRAAASTRH